MKKSIFFIFAVIFLASPAVSVFAQSVGGINVQTNSATNIYSNSATLNGYVSNPIYNSSTYAWFQWGTTTNYGNETNHQAINFGSFSQNISNLSANTTYHFRAMAQTSSGYIIYGNDMTFYTSNSGYYGGGILTVNKSAINFSSGGLNWSTSQNASPSDVLGFAIALQAGNQDIHNVFVRDSMPSGLIYQNNFTITGSSNYTGNDIASGITINTIPANQIVIIGYQAQVASFSNFSYGVSTLNNNITATSNETGTITDSAIIYVNKSSAAGATDLPTGVTNKFFTDSFFLPLLLIFLGSWFYFTGRAYKFADWIGERI